MTRHRKPTPPPLSRTERATLDHLVRRGARSMNPTDGNHLIRLWELDRADREQERRTQGGAERANKELKTRAETAESEAGRYRAAWQSARRRAAHTNAALDGVLELPGVQAYMATLTYDEPEPPAHESYTIEDDGELNVRCADCPAYVDNIGDHDDARRWAEEHKADPTPYGEPA